MTLLSRNATHRALTWSSTLSASTAGSIPPFTFGKYDNAIVPNANDVVQTTTSYSPVLHLTAAAINFGTSLSSEQEPILSGQVDFLVVIVTVGGTAPPAGQAEFALTELSARCKNCESDGYPGPPSAEGTDSDSPASPQSGNIPAARGSRTRRWKYSIRYADPFVAHRYGKRNGLVLNFASWFPHWVFNPTVFAAREQLFAGLTTQSQTG